MRRSRTCRFGSQILGQRDKLPQGLLRDREILLLFDADLGSAGQKLASTVETAGSAILREGVEKVLLKTALSSTHYPPFLCRTFQL